jgi:hypothetical protein
MKEFTKFELEREKKFSISWIEIQAYQAKKERNKNTCFRIHWVVQKPYATSRYLVLEAFTIVKVPAFSLKLCQGFFSFTRSNYGT